MWLETVKGNIMGKPPASGTYPFGEEVKKKSDGAIRKKLRTGTFSILAISTNSELMGVAVASGSTSVGGRVPHAKPGVGVVATQACTNVAYGIKGLELLSMGLYSKILYLKNHNIASVTVIEVAKCQQKL